MKLEEEEEEGTIVESGSQAKDGTPANLARRPRDFHQI